jgi:hypothetical protein
LNSILLLSNLPPQLNFIQLSNHLIDQIVIDNKTFTSPHIHFIYAMSSKKAARPKAPAKKRDSVADRHGDAMNVLSIYRLIVEEVIRKSKEEMTQDSHTEQVLQHLQDVNTLPYLLSSLFIF